MAIELKKLLDNLVEKMSLLNAEDIPNIDLYMDQVTTFMENTLSTTKRYEDDKVLTKTMINNYTKNNLLPPPNKKKYSKEHVILLNFIYYLKNVISINDIKKLLTPINQSYFKNNGEIKLEDIYTCIKENELNQIDNIKKEISNLIKETDDTFNDLPSKDSDYLKYFTFICYLSFDVYIKKQLIESMVDIIEEPKPKQENAKSEKTNK